jgi:RNA polymerase subunit RPABC4/transcription elongation factor Spt4
MGSLMVCRRCGCDFLMYHDERICSVCRKELRELREKGQR